MKKPITLLFVFLLIVSCSNDDDDLQTNLSGDTELIFTENSEITIDDNPDFGFTTFEIVSGNRLVFQFSREDGLNNELADDEIFESIIFEVDTDAENFTYTQENFAANNTFYARSCFCGNIGTFPIENGTISGTRINNQSWDIEISTEIIFEDEDGNFDFSIPITVSGTARLSQ